ncbi:hypothetical protein BH09PAT1_BH09PAT1_1510 [soil metagenome]
MSLKVITVPISLVSPDPNNARLHPKRQLEYLSASLKRFGLQKPLVVKKEGSGYVCVAGSGTLQAALSLGWDEIAVVVTTLEKQDIVAYAICDNQIPLHSEWDVDSLSKHLKDMAEWNPMQDWASIGFEDDIIEPLVDEEDTSDSTLRDFLDGKTFDKKDDEKAVMAKPIKVTADQWEVIDQAINIVKVHTGDLKISAGRALELVAADWLSSAPLTPTSYEK